MAKAAILKAAFTAGELSPRLNGRVDIAKYAGGAKQLRNALPRVQGGVRKRPAAVYAHGLTQTANLAPFIVTNTDAHVVAFVANAVYIYPAQLTPSAPSVIVSLGGQFQNPKFRYAQGGATMFATWGPDVEAPHRLVRLSASKWIFEPVTWTPPPAEDMGERPLANITPSGTTGSITLTAAASAFRNADVGRFYEDGTGRALITAFTSATVVSATVQVTIAASASSGGWLITGPPVATCTPSATGPIGQSITLTAGANTWKDGSFAFSHVGAFVEINGGLVEITAVSSATAATGTVRQTLTGTTAAPARSWRLLFNPWNQTNSGVPSAVALHQQRLYLAGTLAQPQTIWATNLAEYYNFAAGTADDSGFSFEIASDQYNPIKHLSSAGELMVFTGGAEFVMRGGVEAPISPTNVQVKPQSAYGTDDVRPVRVGREILFAQRHGRRVRALAYDASTDSFAAPDMSVLAEHLMRTNAIKCWAYAQTPDSVLWMARDDGKLISLSYDRDQDVFAYALHDIRAVQIASMCVVPVNGQDVVFMVVGRSIPATPTVQWAMERLDDTAYLDGQYDSTMARQAGSYTFGAGTVTITHISHGYSTSDSLYFVGWGGGVPNGAYTITVVDPDTYTISAASTPTATGTVSKATTAWPIGVSHFNSQTVTGFYRDVPGGTWKYLGADYTLSAGPVTITLPIAVHELRIGYRIATTIQTLPPEVGTAEGTAQGQAVSVSEVVVRLLDSCGGTVKGAGNPVALPNPIANDAEAVPFTGDFPISTMGWGKNVRGGGWDGTITLEHSEPSPFEVLAIVQKLTVNAG